MITITVAGFPFLFAIAMLLIGLISWAHSHDEWFMPPLFIALCAFAYFAFYGIFAACGCL